MRESQVIEKTRDKHTHVNWVNFKYYHLDVIYQYILLRTNRSHLFLTII